MIPIWCETQLVDPELLLALSLGKMENSRIGGHNGEKSFKNRGKLRQNVEEKSDQF